MIDKTGRIRRGPGEPEFFTLKDKTIPNKSILRAAWIKQKTGYDCDPRSVYLTEATRGLYYRTRPPEYRKLDVASREYLIPEVMELRTSERNTFSTCHYQWWWRYVEWLTPRRPATALWFGSAVHVALAGYYLKGLQRGVHPAETFTKVLEGDRKTWNNEVTEEDEVKWVDARALGIDMLNNYVATYGTDPQYYVLATEQTFALQFKRNGRPYLRYLLTIDGLIRDMDNGQIRILEHKTARDWGILKRLRLDNQAGSYFAAAPHVMPLHDLLKPGEKISGIDYNILRKAKKDDRPENAAGAKTNKPTKAHYVAAFTEWADNVDQATLGKMKVDELEAEAKRRGITVLGDVSKQQPDKYFHREPVFRSPEEQEGQLKRIQAEAKYMEGMRYGNPDYPILKTPGDHCAWCPFKVMCELHESGDDDAVEGFKEAMMTVEDPYLAYHGKAA